MVDLVDGRRHDAVQTPLGEGERRIRETVVAILEADGYDAVQMRDVARVARVSLTKIYALYRTRDELILAALDWWTVENCYAELSEFTVRPDDSLHSALMRVLRSVFEPWERHPGLLAAYFRVRASTGAETLFGRGVAAVFPAAMTALENVEFEFVEDLETILRSLVFGLMGRHTAGEIEVTEILPTIDRTLHWLALGYESGRTAVTDNGKDYAGE